MRVTGGNKCLLGPIGGFGSRAAPLRRALIIVYPMTLHGLVFLLVMISGFGGLGLFRAWGTDGVCDLYYGIGRIPKKCS